MTETGTQDADVPDVQQKKEALRKVLRARTRLQLERLGPDGFRRLSESVCSRIISLPEFAAPRAVAGYAAMLGEVELESLFKECTRTGKAILLPRYRRDRDEYEMVKVQDPAEDTVTGHYGIREPRPEFPAMSAEFLTGEQVLWLAPGLGFDPTGVRLGRGRGYYDGLLRGTRGCRIGVGFDWQVLPSIPCTARDVRMRVVVTDRRVIRCAPSSPALPGGRC